MSTAGIPSPQAALKLARSALPNAPVVPDAESARGVTIMCVGGDSLVEAFGYGKVR